MIQGPAKPHAVLAITTPLFPGLKPTAVLLVTLSNPSFHYMRASPVSDLGLSQRQPLATLYLLNFESFCSHRINTLVSFLFSPSLPATPSQVIETCLPLSTAQSQAFIDQLTLGARLCNITQGVCVKISLSGVN